MWEKAHALAPVGGIAHTALAILRAEVCMKKGSRKRKDRVQQAVEAMANPLVDPMGTYYYYDDMTDAESKQCFFTTGYWAERGGKRS